MAELAEPCQVAQLRESPSAPAPAAARADGTFEELYDEHVAFVWRSVRRLGVADDAAEDVVQGVFLVVHRRWADFHANSTVRTWLFAIVLNVVRDHRRTLRRKKAHRLPANDAGDPDSLPDLKTATPYEMLARAEAARIIDRLLQELDEDKRAVFILSELEQMTAPEIAQATGLPARAVYSRVRAARTDFERAAARLRRQPPPRSER
jgi:RNA polymerase sigma-70 factor (ECF subfamily)